jgi:hypothetical protein
VLVALGAAAAGCGGSSSGGGGGSSALNKAQLDAAANTICAAESTAGEAVPAPNSTSIQDAKKAAAYFDQIDPIISGATAKLVALKPDSSIATDWNAYIALRKQFSTTIHDIRQKADAADPSGLTEYAGLGVLGPKVDTAATKAGAPTCAE